MAHPVYEKCRYNNNPETKIMYQKSGHQENYEKRAKSSSLG